ncbi:putative HD superfamily hydrolase involved in NAD metabolism [Bacillus thermophilus]|uniref:bis(5'-nucleosyl)-tetraphosphatase (symmetrical) n=1 Tax=Siminovitchia thermophila TaxID=1245522 RepID=A0ABS2R9L3_9BACI|nr:bis(5'-nucleosyl)-tetraphosphatase (symmetrical) YqeK [Siminovitchia thermophila]MBM7716335.1 putative HD superfamily hydrolase involved in NAD metabolism [Siminovitchia thermophila]ONK24173.1 phosphohydrolase [Bacillus sp. VT-16-64]
MDREEALQIVKQRISGPRFDHTVRVLKTALDLAVQYGADEKKTEIAAIFHDYAKLQPISELKKVILEKKLDSRLLDYHSELWHGPVAASIVQEEMGVHDKDVINAIRYHTTGRAGMSLLEKIIYLADYIEPGRQFPGLDEVRALAKTDLDLALTKAIGNTMKFLIDQSAQIFPDTLEAYNDMVK